MGIKDFVIGYPRGRELAPGEPIIQSTSVTLINGAPASLDEDSLRAIGGIPPTGDEHLILTPGYLIYKTDYEFINALAQGFEWGSRIWGPPLTGAFWKQVRRFMDTEDRSFWLPWSEVRRIGWDCDEVPISGWLGGPTLVPHFYYWAELAGGTLWFLQTPVGDRIGERLYDAMAEALGEMCS